MKSDSRFLKLNRYVRAIYLKYPLLFFVSLFSVAASCDDTLIDGVSTGDYNTVIKADGSLTITETGDLVMADDKVDCLYEIDAANWSFTNNGKIESYTAPVGHYLLHYRQGFDDGVRAYEVGNYKIVNTGLISLSGSNQGLVYSNGFNANIDVTNSGTISSDNFYSFKIGSLAEDTNPAFQFKTTGGQFTLHNESTGKILSKNASVILVTNTLETVDIDNAGEIRAGKTAIESAGETTIHNSGTITGETAIALGAHDDNVILEPTSSIEGFVKAGAGIDTLTLEGTAGTGNINQVSDYQGFEKLVKKDGSSWVLKGTDATFTDSVEINGGNLLLDNNVTLTSNNITVSTGATFGGFGSVQGNVTNSGILAIASAAPGMSDGEMSNFTINGDYTSDNGDVVMNMALADDVTSAGSMLIITGDTAGTTNVTINNVGGLGGQTIEGIEVIDVGGQSNGVFQQKGRIVAGAYDYTLVKGKTSDINDGNWYLTSNIDPEPTPSPEPTPTPSPEPTPTPYSDEVSPPARPEAGSYLGNQSAAKAMFISTMHDRMGEQNFMQTLASNTIMPSTWMRTSGTRTESTAGNNVENTIDTSMFQLGNDITAWSANGTDRGHVGFMFGYGYAKTDSYSAVSKEGARHSTGKTQGYNTGLYGTWYADSKDMTGLYIDSSLQYSWFDNETKGEGLASQKYDSDLWQASVETGYSALVIQNAEKSLYVEPQAQVIYSSMNSDDFNEQNGTRIHNADATGYTSRLGMRIFGRVIKDSTAVEPFVEANWWHDSAPNAIQMNSDKVYDDTPSNRYEVKGGVEGKIKNNFHSWASVGYQTGENDYSQLTGMVGVKYIW